ncbi:UNVERIFIED_CONTAM: hypothetical protein HDU68_006935 [Siphonaria sp. JEL0065]|nr:hypothetical protein HDU68_006935 [Siphonaria sp. JEL0065]
MNVGDRLFLTGQLNTTLAGDALYIPDLHQKEQIKALLHAIPAIMGIFGIAFCFLFYSLYLDIGWKIYKKIGADPNMRCKFALRDFSVWAKLENIADMYRIYCIFVMLLKLDVFFMFGFGIQFLVLIIQPGDPEFGITIAAIPILMGILAFALHGVRSENKSITIAFMFGLLLADAYFGFKIFRIFTQPEKYQYTKKYLTFFASLSIIVVTLSMAVTGFCYTNFGMGLAEHITPHPLQGKPASSFSTILPNKATPRILYYNRHSGCHNNMVQVTSRLGLNFSQFDPILFGGLGMEDGKSKEVLESGIVKIICDSYDVIIVADTMPDARPLLESLIQDKVEDRCQSNLVMELTTRFDWGVPDNARFAELIWKVTHSPTFKSNKLFWVSNNPLEPLDLAYETLATPEFRILRSTGNSDLPANNITALEAQMVVTRELEDSKITRFMNHFKIPITKLGHFYGGPHTLAKYQGFIEFPYQVSTMKMYENLAAGVVQLFPSKTFLEELVMKKIHDFHPWDKLQRIGKTWPQYMDYYHPDVSPHVYYFDSFDHLKNLVASNKTLDTKNVRTSAPLAFQKMVKDSLRGWADLFYEMGYEVIVDGEKHINGTGPRKFRSPLYNTTFIPPSNEVEWSEEYTKSVAWREKSRMDWLEESDRIVENLSALESKLTVPFFDPQELNTRHLVLLADEFSDIDTKLIQLLDFVNGEFGKSENEVFGGSLLQNSVDSFAGESLMKNVYQMLMSLVPNTMIEPSELSTAAKLQMMYYLFQRVFINGMDIQADSLNAVGNEKQLFEYLSSDEVVNVRMRLQGSVDKIIYPWSFSSRFTNMKHLLTSFVRKRGIVMLFGDFGYDNAMTTILYLRKTLNCTLPIEIYYNGGSDIINPKTITALNSINDVITLDLQMIFEESTLPGFFGKPFAVLFSTFQEVIYLDDDVLLFQNPERILEDSIIYKEYGHLFWRSREPTEEGITNNFVRHFITHPSRYANTTRFFNKSTRSEMDASVMMFDKRKPEVVHALLATCHFNLKQTILAGLNRFLRGDKDTYWLAYEMLRIPYKFVPTTTGAVGIPARDRNGTIIPGSICGPPSFSDENGRLFFVNRRSAFYRADLERFKDNFTHLGTPADMSSIPAEVGGASCLFDAVVVEATKHEKSVVEEYLAHLNEWMGLRDR